MNTRCSKGGVRRRSTATTTKMIIFLLAAVIFFSDADASNSTNEKINRCPLRPLNNNVHRPPLIVGHRGASFHIPEHTLPSYRLALELGADYIEPDLVSTKDGVLIAMHDIDLNSTTNVHTYDNGQFQNRARKNQDNGNKNGYYVNDFTWDEIQQLRVRQRVEGGARFTGYDYLFPIPSFAQIIDLLHDWNTNEVPLIGRSSSRTKKTGGVPGLYVELKQSHYFQQDGLDMTDLFLDELEIHPKARELLFDHVTLCDEGLKDDEYRVPPLVVQAFEGDVLLSIRNKFKERWTDFVQEDAILSAHVGVGSNGSSSLMEDKEQNEIIDHREFFLLYLLFTSSWSVIKTKQNKKAELTLFPEFITIPAWMPPLVLLVRESDCHNETFWSGVEQLHVSGLGPNKNCFLPSSDAILSNDTLAIDQAKRTAIEWVSKAHSMKLAVHPYTVCLEKELYGFHVGGVPLLFSSAEEELRYYYCDLQIDGIFSENIEVAQIVGAEGCKSEEGEEGTPIVDEGQPLVCIKQERNLWLFGLALLSIGAFVGSITSAYASFYCRKETHITNRPLPLQEVHTSLEQQEEDEII